MRYELIDGLGSCSVSEDGAVISNCHFNLVGNGEISGPYIFCSGSRDDVPATSIIVIKTRP